MLKWNMELLLTRDCTKQEHLHSSCSVFVNSARQDAEVIKLLINGNFRISNIKTLLMTLLLREVLRCWKATENTKYT